jgi:hypothetical protein
MSYQPAHTPGPGEKFTVCQVAHDEVPYWFHAYSRKPPYTTNTALGFNRGWGLTRFSPIHNPDGGKVHTYYAASNRDGAYMASVLHDVPLGVPAFFDRTQLETWHLAKIRLDSPISFVSFHSHHLPALGLTRQQLIDSLPADYSYTRPWAAAAFAQCPDAVAIGYTSRRNDTARCLMLVEQRLPSTPFELVEDGCIGTSSMLRREVLDLVESLGVSVL